MPNRCLDCDSVFPESDQHCPSCGAKHWTAIKHATGQHSFVSTEAHRKDAPPIITEPMRHKICSQCDGTRHVTRTVPRSFWQKLILRPAAVQMPCDKCDGYGYVQGTPEEVHEFLAAQQRAKDAHNKLKQEQQDLEGRKRAEQHRIAYQQDIVQRQPLEELERQKRERERNDGYTSKGIETIKKAIAISFRDMLGTETERLLKEANQQLKREGVQGSMALAALINELLACRNKDIGIAVGAAEGLFASKELLSALKAVISASAMASEPPALRFSPELVGEGRVGWTGATASSARSAASSVLNIFEQRTERHVKPKDSGNSLRLERENPYRQITDLWTTIFQGKVMPCAADALHAWAVETISSMPALTIPEDKRGQAWAMMGSLYYKSLHSEWNGDYERVQRCPEAKRCLQEALHFRDVPMWRNQAEKL